MKKLLLLTLLFQLNFVFAQDDVFTDEITYQDNKVYYNGKPLSGWLFSAEDGIPNQCDCTLKAKYKKGVLDGVQKKWYANGKPKEFSNYSNGIILNKTLFFKNGNIRKKEVYNNGTIISSILYNKDGSKKGGSYPNITQQTTNSSVAQTNTDVLGSNQTNLITTPIINNNEYQQQGLLKTFFPDGKIKKIELHKNGMLVKDSIFYQNGNLKITKKYTDGELIHSEEYLQNKTLVKEQNFINNKKHGLQRENFENGSPNLIENFDNGELVHKEIYHKNGNLLNEENYKFGKKNGLQKTFDETGNLVLLQEFNMNILIKNERYTDEGKEVLRTINEVTEIKLYNKSDQLIAQKYENIKTKQKDSLWIKYDPKTGFKTEETSYINGFITKKGAYKDNKKEGAWIYYWQDKKGEIVKHYKDDNLIKTKAYTYAKQIKNNKLEGDVILNYKILGAKPENNYILLRLIKKNDAYTNQLEQILSRLFRNNFETVTNTAAIANEELFTSIIFQKIDYRFNPKKEGSKKFVAYVNTKILTHNFSANKESEKSITASPVNSKNKNIKTLYTKDKQEAFMQTLLNFEQKIKNELLKSYPSYGKIVKVVQQTKSEVYEVIVYFENNKDLKPKDTLIILDKNGVLKVKLRVIKTTNRTVSCKVKEGGKWLKTYMKTVENPIVQKSISTN